MAEIDPQLLKVVLAEQPDSVQLALDKIHDGTPIQTRVSDFKVLDPLTPLEHAVIGYVVRFNKVTEFIAALAGLGHAVMMDDAFEAQIARLRKGGIDHEDLAAFSLAAKAFRCRILVNGKIAGSGVLVSYRFVLTAWHVISRKGGWDPAKPPRIEVLTSGGEKLSARPSAPYSPCHELEWDGQVPEDDDLIGFDDYALLRLGQPVGFALGFARFVCPAPVWDGNLNCLLVHFPKGVDVGLSPGMATFDPVRRRLRHTARTYSGSSGGAVFTNQLSLVGIHQKKFGAHPMFVPVRNFANDNTAALLLTIEGDRKPSYLWSIGQSLDNHLIIGRRIFFEALDFMVDSKDPAAARLRGVWVRRKEAEHDLPGLGFAHDILHAFLARRQPDAHLVRIALHAGEYDLFARVTAAISAVESLGAARAGVRADETTAVAFEADRADALVRGIEQALDGPIWLFVEGPRSELAGQALQQLEQLLARLLRSDRIRFVLTRMETHQLPLARFESLNEITPLSAPGIINEYTGDFGVDDVKTTLIAASQDLDLDLTPEAIDDMARIALVDITPEFGRYPAGALDRVAAHLAERLRERVAIA